jgi:hypothetical protein
LIAHFSGEDSTALELKYEAGVPNSLAFTRSLLNFGSIDLGNVGVREVAIQNLTNIAATGLALAISGGGSAADQFYLKGDSCSGRDLEAGETCSVVVVFDPNSANAFRGASLVASYSGSSISSLLSGTGTVP